MGQAEMLDLKWYPGLCSLLWLSVPSAGKITSNSPWEMWYRCPHDSSSWKTATQSCLQLKVVTLSVGEAMAFERAGKICIGIQICLIARAIFKTTKKEVAFILLRIKGLFIMKFPSLNLCFIIHDCVKYQHSITFFVKREKKYPSHTDWMDHQITT